MTHFDVFNGDADGLCALHQLRLARPRASVPVTGPKRAITLLEEVDAGPNDSVTVLDLSLDANREALDRLLARGVSVEYYDHHYAGTVPRHPRLVAHLDPSPDVCTGIIVDRVVQGAHRPWAIVAAFGDNLEGPARALADSLHLDSVAVEALQQLGEDLAYNAYGDDCADLIAQPVEILAALRPYVDPWAFLEGAAIWRGIRASRLDDLRLARMVPPRWTTPRSMVIVLPDEAWSRRVRGALANELVGRAADHAIAVLSPVRGGGYTASVRAARNRPHGVDAFCRSFPSGGGRAAAGGINRLAVCDLERFALRFAAALG